MKNERGLTLVELLAVIVILGIISTIAFVSIGKIISNSKADAHLANAREILSAGELAYASGHEPTHKFYNEGKYYQVNELVEMGLLGDKITNNTNVIKDWKYIEDTYNLKESMVLIDDRDGKHVFRVNLSMGSGNFIFDKPQPMHKISRDAFTDGLKKAFFNIN